MEDLYALVSRLALPGVALALDTGHARLAADVSGQTLAAGALLRTTHVHDNDGRRDSHEVPGRGTIDWPAWGRALDAIGYAGPILLECVRQLRPDPTILDPALLAPLLGSDRGD
jgi:sugar phosphate isomerase/epimerase